MIPNIAIVEIQNLHWRGCRFWVPLILLWIPLILLSPLILLVILAACIAGSISFSDTVATLWAILTSLPGTQVHVESNGSKVFVRIQ
ncbi:MAG TPA: hypothetical protein VHD85_11120 [Terracidiphilus sp.]|nr:hypothetical protein [Terracidiphilus sp.]